MTRTEWPVGGSGHSVDMLDKGNDSHPTQDGARWHEISSCYSEQCAVKKLWIIFGIFQWMFLGCGGVWRTNRRKWNGGQGRGPPCRPLPSALLRAVPRPQTVGSELVWAPLCVSGLPCHVAPLPSSPKFVVFSASGRRVQKGQLAISTHLPTIRIWFSLWCFSSPESHWNGNPSTWADRLRPHQNLLLKQFPAEVPLIGPSPKVSY